MIENGGNRTIDASTAVDSYVLRTGGNLTANGAVTQQITATTGSKVTLNGTTTTAVGISNGVDLSASQATIANGSKVFSARIGVALVQSAAGASTAVISASEVNGGEFGAFVSTNSQLTLQSKASVTGSNPDGIGIRTFGGQVTATDSSITGGLNGISFFADRNLSANNRLILDGSRVEGLSGSAIIVDGQTQTNNQQVNIQVNNGSTLKGGNPPTPSADCPLYLA
ncbi:hypothetical protein [Pseudomonas vancouverensis]|uniref:Uncharacterized protein n=1 Tax=Pseudomonas vancouverensis TaxID=95300 RepID=A0A4R4K4N1_PSEVA|nr:hypothetical protein [Pseudomonas vancouverensis]KAB0494156.1 hypothetical protein F7R09_20510 [Pseudomonas vancouverensis]TDB61592.1 hypothetical protein EIY72_16160 [Pseudomonas vancouverensis]